MFRHRGISRRSFIRKGVTGIAGIGALTAADWRLDRTSPVHARPVSVPDKLAVLTFDDAVKSHRTVVAPLLKDLGFGATFFVTHRWMDDRGNFLSWKEIAELHQMGFEIGNHSWTHDDFSTPRNAARLAGELALVEYELKKVGVPRPLSFAYPGNHFGPEALRVLARRGYKYARRGMQPEVEYGEAQVGPGFDPARNHPLLIPSTGDAYPNWTMEHFERLLAERQKIVVLQFHGVPDRAHPWVHTPPEAFRNYMTFLKQNGWRALALRDLEPFVDLANPPADPLLKERFPKSDREYLDLPAEVLATRADLAYWLENMLRFHRYTRAEAAEVCGMSEDEVQAKAAELRIPTSAAVGSEARTKVRVLPYPGGRQPRIGNLEGASNPMRGTKASVFLPWDPRIYVVVDLPEGILDEGLVSSGPGATKPGPVHREDVIFHAHTHLPTIWNHQNLTLENIDWNRGEDDVLRYRRTLPNGLTFGASIRPVENYVEMELWLRNFTGRDLGPLRAPVCVMLKGAPPFNAQTNENKIFRRPVAAVRSSTGDRWILTVWEPCGGGVAGNPSVPCMHSDPVFPACPFAGTVRVHGRLWFYEGEQIEREIERAPKILGRSGGTD